MSYILLQVSCNLRSQGPLPNIYLWWRSKDKALKHQTQNRYFHNTTCLNHLHVLIYYLNTCLIFTEYTFSQYPLTTNLNVSLTTALTYWSLDSFSGVMASLFGRTSLISLYSFSWATGFFAKQYNAHKIPLDVWDSK